MKILAVASSGGHWVQLRRLADAFEGHTVTYVTVNPAHRDEVAPARFYAVPDANRETKLRLILLTAKLCWIRLHSSLAVSSPENGSSLAALGAYQMTPIHVPAFSGSGRLSDRNGLWLWSELTGIGDTLQVVLDTLTAHIAILDAWGDIIAINDAWRQFAQANGLDHETYGLGMNYLTVCEAAQAHDVAQGIREVLAGRRDTYCLEYPCASPEQDNWFRLSVNLLPAPGGGQVLVAHDDITELRQLQAAYQHAHAELLEYRERLQTENRYLQDDIESRDGFEDIIGRSPVLLGLLGMVERVAPTDATVLISGETGTGKELIARALHGRSPRHQHPLIKVNCAALPATLIESELFGHEKGAFTGALSRKVGRFEIADGGTLFLDEIGELSLDLQAKLLHVLQNGEFERLGSTKTQQVNVRVIAATNRNLIQAVGEGSFREDLYYRLNVFPLTVPPLRDRREDIPLLVWAYLMKHQGRLGKHIEEVASSVMESLIAYEWPSNVRELHNVLERAMILSPGSTLMMDKVFEPSQSWLNTELGSQRLDDVERTHIQSVLVACDWQIKGAGKAAERLGLRPSTLWSRMKKLGVTRP